MPPGFLLYDRPHEGKGNAIMLCIHPHVIFGLFAFAAAILALVFSRLRDAGTAVCDSQQKYKATPHIDPPARVVAVYCLASKIKLANPSLRRSLRRSASVLASSGSKVSRISG